MKTLQKKENKQTLQVVNIAFVIVALWFSLP
jgi:hypothetical protein